MVKHDYFLKIPQVILVFSQSRELLLYTSGSQTQVCVRILSRVGVERVKTQIARPPSPEFVI